MNIGCCIRLGDANVYYHLRPIAEHPAVSKFHIIRHAPVSPEIGNIPKSVYHIINPQSGYSKFLQMYRTCRNLVLSKQVDAFVSFNPVPYGYISALAAKDSNIPVHFGFIGKDWNGKMQRFFLKATRSLLKNISMFTVTGKNMKAEMLSFGIPESKIKILPHSIEIDKFPVNSVAEHEYDLVFIGQIIQRKRVDIILESIANVKNSFPQIKACIVGEGPLRQQMEKRASSLGINDNVVFTGYSTEVNSYLAKSRIFLITSDSEGLPFALVEAMSCGLVPVCTDVGTIKDVISNGKTGFLIKPGSVQDLTEKLQLILSNRELYEKNRRNILEHRKNYSFDSATKIWDDWFKTF